LLRLKRIELQGFKSFADRTELRFDGAGIVAIVGPNGCGKSNLADAIQWVLGEQSAKSLRGARMEDVIFAGTRERKPVSLAQVTMTLAEPAIPEQQVLASTKPNGKQVNGKAGSQPKQVTVTRRLFRSGESEYLIDGRPARLRDIQDLFMGTGLGGDSYAIIEQGRIGQILSSKPQDRRLVIEEAAGISRYKTKRRLAEARLEGAKHNLERVFDILEEVGRQMNSLKRQAAKARRYEDLKAQMCAQLRLVLAARHRLLEREAARIAVDLSLATSQLESLGKQVAEKESSHEAAQQTVFGLESELLQARQRLAELQVTAERVSGQLDSAGKQAATIEDRLQRGAAEAEQLQVRCQELASELAAQRSALVALEQEETALRQKVESKARERSELERKLTEVERAIESARQAVLRLMGEAAALRNQLAQMDEHLAAIERDAARAGKEEQSALSDLEWLEQSERELAAKAQERQQQLEELRERRRGVEQALAEARRQAEEARRQQDALRAELSRVRARRDSLEEILSHRAYTTEAVKRLFTAVERGQGQNFSPLGVLADFLEVDPAWEKAAEEFLHDELEYVVVDCWDQAERGLELLRTLGDGRATFLVRPEPRDPGAATRPQPEPGDQLPSLRDVLRLNGSLGEALLDSLPRINACRLVSDEKTARELAAVHPALYFLLPDGVCYHGQALSGGRKSAGGPLALKRELRELRTLAQAREQELAAVASRREQLEKEIAALEQELEAVRAAQQGLEKENVTLEHERRKLAEDLPRVRTRLSVARRESERLANEKQQLQAQRECNLEAIAEKERVREQCEQELADLRRRWEELKSLAARSAEEHSAVRVELAGVEERRRAQAAALNRLEAEHRQSEARRAELSRELSRLEQEKARLAESNARLLEQQESLRSELASCQERVAQLEAEEVRRRDEMLALAEELRSLRTELQAAQEQRSRIELELVRRQADLRYLDETSRKELGVPAAELSAAEATIPDEEELAAAEQKYQELKERIEALGPVNPQALEEFKETEQRYNFLNAQRQDLLDSIRDTEQAIREIDAETRKRFQEAFSAINQNFGEMFQRLFGGGSAEMRLTDPENLAESGIDIVASPPGKRLQNVLLLSGGEKALTALALLLAIFKYQPSPFCVLDEVDAPLDDPNIDRLMRILREMSAQTQFIVITHTKRTMEAADVLYGVTMQEPGVSKLVSVRLPTPAAASPPPATLELAARA
jgi:chromosome segregation protein